jgi:hypothetical protein
MILFITNAFAEHNVGMQQSQEAVESARKLDLSIPEKDLEYKPDTSKKAVPESKEEEAKRKHCADLSRKIEELRGQYKLARRSALINQHRVECLNKGPWEATQHQK